MAALLEYFDLNACLCLQVATAAGDYPLDLFHLLIRYSGGQPQVTFGAMGSHCQSIFALQSSSAAVIDKTKKIARKNNR